MVDWEQKMPCCPQKYPEDNSYEPRSNLGQ
jgi:hypothetical protein